MNALECTGVTKSFGEVRALEGADLAVVDGHLTALLGPSGCGKSTLLRIIAGFERPDAGTVSVSGEVVAGTGVNVPPERRRTGIVPQEQALFPHLDVAGNVAYGLGRDAARGSRVGAMLELCGLDGLGSRMPHELSGGQQQRVALARALAPQPSVVLLDEPFASLDATLRASLRSEIATILRAAGQTALLVTHDQDEALSMADTVGVMRAGRIVQHATPATLYRHPVDAWVARFVGSANVLDGTLVGPGLVSCALGTLPAEAADGDRRAVRVVIRPEQVLLGTAAGVTGDAGARQGTVQRCEYYGHDALVWVTLGDDTANTDNTVMARIVSDNVLTTGSTVVVTCSGSVVVLPAG